MFRKVEIPSEKELAEKEKRIKKKRKKEKRLLRKFPNSFHRCWKAGNKVVYNGDDPCGCYDYGY